MTLVPPDSIPLGWRIAVLLLTIAATVVIGILYGIIAIYEASYLAHFVIAGGCALVIFGIQRLPPDNTPDFCVYIALTATVFMLGAGIWAALEFIQDDFPGKSIPGAVLAHAEEGVWFDAREYGRSGRWIDKLRQGIWVYLAWVVQFVTLPVILFIGALSGGYRAHTKSTPASEYETALDIVVERNREAANPFVWKPLNTHIESLHLRELARLLVYNYARFAVPLMILGAMALVFPEHEARPFFIFWASLFMLGAANATLTGEPGTRLSVRAAFDQFFLFARLGGLLVLSFIAAFFLTLLPVGFLSMAGLGFEDMFMTVYIFFLLSLMVVVLIRLWPMMVMHYLFDDVDLRENSGAGMSRRMLKNSLWHGAPGPSLALAWQFTGIPGALVRATLPALVVPFLILGLHSEIYVRTSGVSQVLLDVILYAVIVPFAYLVLMDRALALRHCFLTDPDALPGEITPEPGTVGHYRRQQIDDDMQDFLNEIPRAWTDDREMAAFAQRHQQKHALDEAGDDPDKLLAAAITQQRSDWFDIALEKGADPDGGIREGEQQYYRKHLCRAVNRRHIGFVDRLLEAGADLHSSEGGLPLHAALGTRGDEDRIAMLKHLLALGASVNARGHDGHTALTLAARNGLAEDIAILLANGANWRMRSANGYSAVDWALYQNRPEALKLLLDEAKQHRDFNINDPDLYRVGRLAHDCLPVLLAAGMDPNLDLGDGIRLIHAAAGDGLPKQIMVLLDYGADFTLKTDAGYTPMELAEWGKMDERREFLFRHCQELLANARKRKRK